LPCSQALALVFTFGSSKPTSQAVTLTLLCLLYSLLHLRWIPMRSAPAQTLQALLLLSLTVVAISGVPSVGGLGPPVPNAGSVRVVGAHDGEARGTGFEAHTDPAADVTASPQALVQGLRTAFGVVVPALAVTWAYLGRSVVRWALALRTRVRESAMF
jgi:hypothetical protein